MKRFKYNFFLFVETFWSIFKHCEQDRQTIISENGAPHSKLVLTRSFIFLDQLLAQIFYFYSCIDSMQLIKSEKKI